MKVKSMKKGKEGGYVLYEDYRKLEKEIEKFKKKDESNNKTLGKERKQVEKRSGGVYSR